MTKMTNVTTHDDIAQRAYALWLERGGLDGYDLEDWLAAERELTDAAEYHENETRRLAADDRFVPFVDEYDPALSA